MSKCCVYSVLNLINGKIYVGKSTDPHGRWGDHKKVASGGKEKYPTEFFAVHAALRKYGAANFRFMILEEFETEDDAYYFESWWIEFLETHRKTHGYNCNMGGVGGIKPTEETRQKLIFAQNKPEKVALSSRLMRERHKQNPRFLGRLSAKLTEQQVIEIRDKYSRGEAGYLKLAKMYGVGQTAIRKIISRKTWSHI